MVTVKGMKHGGGHVISSHVCEWREATGDFFFYWNCQFHKLHSYILPSTSHAQFNCFKGPRFSFLPKPRVNSLKGVSKLN